MCCRLTVTVMPDDNVPGHLLDTDARGGNVMAQNEEGWCAAIDPYHLRCTIYSQRPAICRQFDMGGDDCRLVRQDYRRQQQDLSTFSSTIHP